MLNIIPVIIIYIINTSKLLINFFGNIADSNIIKITNKIDINQDTNTLLKFFLFIV